MEAGLEVAKATAAEAKASVDGKAPELRRIVVASHTAIERQRIAGLICRFR